MGSKFQALKKEIAAFCKKHKNMVAEDFLPGAFSNNSQQSITSATKTPVKAPESTEDIANMSDEEVQQYFYNEMPKSQVELAPELKTSLFDRIDKIRKDVEAKQTLVNTVESMLQELRDSLNENTL